MTQRSDRTNDEWLADLRAVGDAQSAALHDLQMRLQRGIFYYLSRERSDLSNYGISELTQMAQDMAQDATLRVIDNLDNFRGDSLFTTWATRIAVRVAISDLRRARYKDFSLDDLTANGELMPSASPIAGDRPTLPEHATEQNEVMRKIEETIRAGLTEKQYQALLAVAVEDVPLEVIAERMGTNRNALYKLIHDARRKLRSQLEAQGLTMDYIYKLFQK